MSENMSDQIRRMHSQGMSTTKIAQTLNIRYQHAYRVIHYKKSVSIKSALKAIKVSKGKKKSIKMFDRMNYQVKRGMMELLTIQDLNEKEWNEIKNFFNNKCAYCDIEDTGDSRNGLVADHLIPAANYGNYVTGNVIPACHDCNDRRGKQEWETWLFLHFPQTAVKRSKNIKIYLNKFPYTHHSNPIENLDIEDQNEYNSILQEWDILLNRAKNLRNKLKNPH
ncbi:hypothetical protein PTI45_04656 [Paenibacillus nuruki]|uniref:HNH nuclease domain-containing protein n=1 Tax=Paenibacillus nuruki TaxID=1886670 RepID=A0A1E3KZ89_9BACL|nr:HNH endonuclease [Paenibacillus nuruki]ODP26020.1 hypothetical protein PTI45_04656 [Paenibacillus nuruki]